MQDVPREQFVSDFEHWEPEVQAMVDVSEVDVCTTLDARARRRLETRVLDELKRG